MFRTSRIFTNDSVSALLDETFVINVLPIHLVRAQTLLCLLVSFSLLLVPLI